MLVATFNCNSVRQRQGIILRWLEEHQPDVLALQETKVVDEQFPREPFVAAGWHVVYRGEKSYNGVALVCRQPPEEVSFGLQDGDDRVSETRLVAARLGQVHLVNTYVPQGQALDSPKFQLKLEWFARLRRYFEQRFAPESDQLVWFGDLNVAPTPADVYDHRRIWPHVCHCQEVLDAFQPVLDWGFVDVFRQHLPQEQIFTFWDYRLRNALATNRGWRIDHIQATRPLAARSVSCEVDQEPRRAEKPSDHTFVAARFE